MSIINSYPLTQFSHGAGCGCKISPSVLSKILKNNQNNTSFKKLLVGNESRDDAAVFAINKKIGLISTTDFFMPIVDDPFLFGKIASANAISDVYAMGGTPSLALSILGWPVNKIPAEIAQKVIHGARETCKEANIPLAGGHSIDTPEPIFGLCVNGIVSIKRIKKNNTPKEGDLLFLTKPLGVGIITTALKRGVVEKRDLKEATDSMIKLNRIGEELGKYDFIHALTDVTGFGLAGHLLEMLTSSKLTAHIKFENIPVLKSVQNYIRKNCIPGGTERNYKSHEKKLCGFSDEQIKIMCDPQTSGGLLIACAPLKINKLYNIFKDFNINRRYVKSIGYLKNSNFDKRIMLC